jgi:hypothetical protein
VPALATSYACFFPQIKIWMKQPEVEAKYLFENILESFRIKPRKIMSIVPLLMQKRKKFLSEFLHTIVFFMCIFIMGLGVSFIAVITGFYF